MNELATAPNYGLAVNAVEAARAFDLLPVGENTRRDYSGRIPLFIDFINVHGLNRNTLLEFRRSLESRADLGISSKNKYFTAARRYCGILYTAGLVPADLTKDISGRDLKGFKQDKLHRKDGIQPDEMRALADYLRALSPTPASVRLKAMLALLIFQGLRQIELVRLDVTDLDLKRGKALIRGKGRDDKTPVHLHPHAQAALTEYLDLTGRKSGPLFANTSNNATAEDQRLSTRGVRKIVVGVLDELGIENSTHGFRHHFVTALVRDYGGDLLTVAHYSRHRSIEMLTVYNDQLDAEKDLPRYHKTFAAIEITT